ncbi:MAG: S-layer homology domain-containing protein, partial [Tumebacillaceae bacterium]
WFSADMYQQTKPQVMPTDIKGHWAEKSLTHFAEKGLLELVDGKANPDQKLTRAQVVRLLVDARGCGYVDNNVDPTFADVPKDFKYYAQIETALRNGWIAQASKFRPNDSISREEVAAILARVEGFKDLSTHKEIFHVPYADGSKISDFAYGSIAINYGLGVMRGANNLFDPQANVTLAQMVTILDKLASLPSNGPIYYK